MKKLLITLLLLFFVILGSPLLVLAEDNESLNETETKTQEKNNQVDQESELNTEDPAEVEESRKLGEVNSYSNSGSENESMNQEKSEIFDSQQSERTDESEQEQEVRTLNSNESESQFENSNQEFLEELEALGFENNESSIQSFQSYYGVEVTGVANEATVEKIEEILSSPFQEGKSYEESVELKEYLEILGYVSWDSDPTDYFGSSTEEAVREFQEAEGLPVTGIIEPNTRDRLEELATGPLSYGMYREDAVALKENLNKLGFTS
ncbi:peptidoglycan-binding domain-containing protein, partial [Lentibacillus salicampi]